MRILALCLAALVCSACGDDGAPDGGGHLGGGPQGGAADGGAADGGSAEGGAVNGGSAEGGGGSSADGGGGSAACPEGESEGCYDGPAGTQGVGPCSGGTRTCTDGVWGPCLGQALPVFENCDGLDNDCDGVNDNDCATGSCLVQVPLACVPMAAPPSLVPPVTTCLQTFPPTEEIPCDVPSTGVDFYLDPASGDDASDGSSPASAWASLCYALVNLPEGATLNVAEGVYAFEELGIQRAITIKGGWNAAFTEWAPLSHPSVFLGRLTLNHDDAMFAGFQLIGRAPYSDYSTTDHYHQISAGSFVRNYVELDLNASSSSSDAIWAAACIDSTIRVACNHIYHRLDDGPGSASVFDLSLGVAPRGTSFFDSNRICQESWGPTFDSMAETSFPQQEVFITNQIIETRFTAFESYDFPGGNSFDTTVANTIIISGSRIFSEADGSSWTLMNNIFVGPGTGFPTEGNGSGFEARGNLVFDFTDADLDFNFTLESDNDVSNTWEVDDVFQSFATGDLRPLAAGPADGLATNLYADPIYGNITTDLMQEARSVSADWDRGALLP